MAAGGQRLPARIEIRFEETNRLKKDTLEERLAKIKKTIPDAKAIVTHPRAPNKVSVVVRDENRRDQIIQSGLENTEGFKLIRRPYIVMVAGVSLEMPIKNQKCEENAAWTMQTKKRNN